MKITQNFIKGISEKSPSHEGTSANVTRLGAEIPQTLSKGIPGEATAEQWVYRLFNGYLTASADAKKMSHPAHSSLRSQDHPHAHQSSHTQNITPHI